MISEIAACAWASRDFKDTRESALLAIMGRSAQFLCPAMPRCPSRAKGPDHSFGPLTMMEMTVAGISVSQVTDEQRLREKFSPGLNACSEDEDDPTVFGRELSDAFENILRIADLAPS